MVKYERLCEKVYGTMTGFGFEVKMFTEEGSLTINPQEATRFFSVDPTIMVTVNKDLDMLDVHISKDEKFQDTKKFQERMKALANEFLMDYRVKNYTRHLKPRDFSDDAKIKKMQRHRDEAVYESLDPMYGTQEESFQDIGDCKIIVIHAKYIDPEKRGARSRNIDRIEVENNDQRYTMPTNYVVAARAMAQHLNKGGNFSDTIGEHIQENAKKLQELKDFVRYSRDNNLINETTQDVVETVKDNVKYIQKELSRMVGPKSYNAVIEKIQEVKTSLNETEDATPAEEIRDMFSVKVFDEKYESIAPVVARMVDERNHLLNKLEEASEKSIDIPLDFAILDEALTFENTQSKYSFIVSQLANIVESQELSTKLNEIAKKIKNSQTPSAFEYGLVENVLSNTKRALDKQL